MQVQCGDRDDLVAVDDFAAPVDSQHPVRIAIEREAGVVAAAGNRFAKAVDMRGPAAGIDVAPVGLVGDDIDVSAEAAEDLRADAVGGAVRAIQQDPLAGQVEVLEAQLQLAQVVVGGAAKGARASGALGHRGRLLRRQDGLLDARFGLVVQLGADAPEELDAVVAVRVVRRRHDRGQVESEPPCQHRCAGRRQHTTEDRVAPGGRDAGRQRGLEHLARLTRVAHDQDLRCARLRDANRRVAKPEGEIGGQELARAAANAVRAEQTPARHCFGPHPRVGR